MNKVFYTIDEVTLHQEMTEYWTFVDEGLQMLQNIMKDFSFFDVLRWTNIIYAVIALFGCWLYKLAFTPLSRIRRLGDVGYLNHQAGNLSQKELANLIRRRRRLGKKLPPAFPNGWFRLLDSAELKSGKVKEVSALGEHFAVFRSSAGQPHVLDAYCPHMGGNMAQGGRVEGDCLQCPFHGWTFSGDGKCTDIAYAKKIPSVAKAKSWSCLEINDVIFVWYHCDDIKPQWEIPVIAQIRNHQLLYRGRTEHHINTHIQEIIENGSDAAHIGYLHMPNVLAGADMSKIFTSWRNFAQHKFTVSYRSQDPTTPHVCRFKIRHQLLIFGRWSMLNITLDVYQIGPGLSIFYMDTCCGEAVMVNCVTPHEPMYQVMTHAFYTTWRFPTWMAKIFLYLDATQVDRDVMVWNNKTYLSNPILTTEEKSIVRFRKWFSQFYTENSTKIGGKTEDLSW